LRVGGVETVKLPARSPNLNAYAERFVRSIKSECLSKIIPLGERHLRLVVSEYVEHYHLERNHQGLGNRLIERSRGQPRKFGRVARRERLGGVLNFFHRGGAQEIPVRHAQISSWIRRLPSGHLGVLEPGQARV